MATDKKQMVGERMEEFEKRLEVAEKAAKVAEKNAEDLQNKLDKMEGEYGPDGSGRKMRPISQEQVEERGRKYRERGPDKYEARGEDGRLVGSGHRPDALHNVARLKSAGKYPSTDSENRPVMASDGPRQTVTITRIFGYTGKTAVLAVYKDGRLVKKGSKEER